ncbi:MAG: hypothetical protein H0U59_10775 [Gemmatimonadaceae bacterium]|nr:hypothetical protein [Gemmatimonadaceae bacterium]
MARYSKFVVAVVGFLAVVATVLADGIVAPDEYETILFAVATAVGVFLIPNTPPA